MAGRHIKRLGIISVFLCLALAAWLLEVKLPDHAAAAAERARPAAKFQGGSGGSPAVAVVITGVKDYVGVVAGEYQFLRQQFGSAPRSYQIIEKRVYQQGDKVYDVIRVELPNRVKRDIYFDITPYFKKP